MDPDDLAEELADALLDDPRLQPEAMTPADYVDTLDAVISRLRTMRDASTQGL